MRCTLKVWYILVIFALMGTIRQKVALQGVRFFAYHGFYPEEQLLGNEFIIDVETELEVFVNNNDDLNSTVNYERLFQIASDEMATPHKLMETVAHCILDSIRHEFLAVKYIRVAIKKLNPPMAAEIENSLIELIFNR